MNVACYHRFGPPTNVGMVPVPRRYMVVVWFWEMIEESKRVELLRMTSCEAVKLLMNRRERRRVENQ